MKLIWSTSDKIGARLIRWGLRSDCSHFAVVFDDQIVFHSTSSGLDIDWKQNFLKSNRIIHDLMPIEMPDLERQEEIYQSILDVHYRASYDSKALAFWFFTGLWHRVSGSKLPKKNLWQSKRDLLCTEVAPLVLKALGIKIDGVDFSMVAPHDLFAIIKETGKFN